jgi:tetratricopeptide (TPR) repeat protein
MRTPEIQAKFEEVYRIKKEALDSELSGTEVEIKVLRIRLCARAKVLLDHAAYDDEEVQFELSLILGSFYRKLELWDESESLARRAVELRPSYPGAVNSLYLTLVKMGLTSQALEVLELYAERFSRTEFADVIGEIYQDYKDGHLDEFAERIQLLAKRAGHLSDQP